MSKIHYIIACTIGTLIIINTYGIIRIDRVINTDGSSFVFIMIGTYLFSKILLMFSDEK